MTSRERKDIFQRVSKLAISGDAASAELCLRQYRAQLTGGPAPGFKFVLHDDQPGPDVDGLTLELPPGRERLLLEAGPAEELPAPRPKPAKSYENMTFEDLSPEEIAAFAADGWRSAPDHVRPKGSQIPSTRQDAPQRRQSLISGLERYAGPYRGGEEPGENDGYGSGGSNHWDMSNRGGNQY
jgi:hypothetical protein